MIHPAKKRKTAHRPLPVPVGQVTDGIPLVIWISDHAGFQRLHGGAEHDLIVFMGQRTLGVIQGYPLHVSDLAVVGMRSLLIGYGHEIDHFFLYAGHGAVMYLLAEIGCNVIQGYYVGRPMPMKLSVDSAPMAERTFITTMNMTSIVIVTSIMTMIMSVMTPIAVAIIITIMGMSMVFRPSCIIVVSQ